MSFLNRIISAIVQLISYSAHNTAFGVIFMFGLTIFILYDKFIKLLFHRICLIICIFLLTIGVYGGGRSYVYYYLIYSPFIVFGIVASVITYVAMILVTSWIYPDQNSMDGAVWVTGSVIQSSMGTVGMVFLAFAISFGVFTGLNGFYMSSSRLIFAFSTLTNENPIFNSKGSFFLFSPKFTTETSCWSSLIFSIFSIG